MKRTIIKLLFIMLTVLCICLLLSSCDSDRDVEIEADTVGLGGGGAFFIPMVNPVDSNNYLVTCDMGGLYWSVNAGKEWHRTESRFWFKEAMISDDGTVFCGSYGLYASFDKGASLQRVYPKNVKYAVSRCGWAEELLVADDYNDGYIKCISTHNNRVYFVTLDWYGEMRLISCGYDGSDVTEYFVRKTDIFDNPVYGVSCKMLVEDDCILYTFGNELRKYDFDTGSEEVVYRTSGTLNDFEKIDDYYFILDNIEDKTAVMYGRDFENLKNLNDFNNLTRVFYVNSVRYTIDWIFNDICGNSFNSIFLSYNSDDGEGVLFFDGSEFHWVFDNYHKNRSFYGIDGWSYGCYGPFYGICNVKGNDGRCLVASIETVYELNFADEKNCSAKSLHCTSYEDYRYSTTGLDVLSAYNAYEDPFDKNHIIICTNDVGLQMSYDGGKTWSYPDKTENGYIQNTCYDLYFDPTTEERVYSLWSSRHGAPHNGYFNDNIHTEGAFAISYDGGVTWDFDNYSTGLPKDSIPVKMFVQHNGHEDIIAVACFNYGFYISYDSGRHFFGISDDMENVNGYILGEDVVIDNNSVYCLTSWYYDDENSPGTLYKYDIDTEKTEKIDLGDIIIPRSLTWNEDNGLYINVVPFYHYQWSEEWKKKVYFNFGGGVYHLENGKPVLIFEDEYGVFNSAFGSDGRLYMASLNGTVFCMQNGKVSIVIDGLFPNLKNISILDDNIMYVTSLGGGIFQIKNYGK